MALCLWQENNITLFNIYRKISTVQILLAYPSKQNKVSIHQFSFEALSWFQVHLIRNYKIIFLELSPLWNWNSSTEHSQT